LSAAEMRQMVTEYYAAGAAGDVDAVMKTFLDSNDTVLVEIPKNELQHKGLAAIRKQVSALLGAYTNRKAVVNSVCCDEAEQVCWADVTLSGDQTNIYDGLTPTTGGKSFHLAVMFKFKQGKICNQTVFLNGAEFLHQYYAIPDVNSCCGRTWLACWANPCMIVRSFLWCCGIRWCCRCCN